jgi:hypothetical protein
MPRRKLDDPIKVCANCGAPMERKRFPSGTLEDRAQFLRRKFCNQACMALVMEGRIKVRNEQNSRRQSAKSAMDRCEICGRTGTRLYVHHKDENPLSNTPTNLQTLCGSCHRRLHSPNYTGTAPQRKPCLLCSKPAARKGYCNTHLTRLKRHGDPLLVLRGNALGTRLVKLGS